jgi:folate-binding protein YgfZ
MAEGQENDGGVACGWCRDERVAVLHLAGVEALDLIQRLSANNVSLLTKGQTASTPLLTEKGRIVDILTIRHEGERLLVLCSALRSVDVQRWIEKFIISEDVEVYDVTQSYAVTWLVDAHSDSRLIPHYASKRVWWRVDTVDSSLTSSPGKYESARLDERMMQLSPAERDLRSLLLGIPSAPGEINGRHTPYDVNLRHLLSFTKGCYIGQEVIARLDTYGKTHKHMVGLTGRAQIGNVPPLEVRKEGLPVGMLTSVSPLPASGVWPALAVVEMDAVNDGDTLEIEPGVSLNVHSLPMGL